jgi:glyoxylase-like metal-dependent hydrolase (beta-lactamase superfamily II)
MTTDATWEVLAVRYGSRVTTRADYYLRFATYGEPDGPLPMDYFFWVLRGPSETILVDTGWNPAVAAGRGRTLLLEPARAMEELGAGPGTVSRVVVTHLHWDHTGNLRLFPDAQLLVQERELELWGSPIGRRLQFSAHAEADDIEHVLQADWSGRVQRLRGDADLAPGVQARLVGGHSPGQMLLVVETASGPVVLASDVIHYYEELERDWPCSILADLAETYAGYDLLRELGANGKARIVAGHDPLVLERFPRAEGELADHVARLA